MHRVGVVGGSGYTGAELMRIIAGHPDLELAFATGESHAGTAVGDLYPSLAAAMDRTRFVGLGDAPVNDVDLLFLALPHGESQKLVPSLPSGGPKIIDLAADFRLKDPDAYATWYGEAHAAPGLLDRFVYGLPELFGGVADATALAAPGCYPTASALALTPLVRAGIVERDGIVVDAASGVSGAGRSLKHTTHFGTANEDFVAYGLLGHRHTPEIEQATGARVLFTPHLAPMTRGILATCYARPAAPTSTAALLELLTDAYAGSPFVVVDERPPSTKSTWGSNAAHVTARYDTRTGWVVALCAIDNLVKGASGQAVQCANLMLGLGEACGLSAVGVYP
jgi:N-acetyl-gamma-glutamyl-phosphate reductase